NVLKTTDPSGTFINTHDFTSSASAPLYPGQLRIGFFGISSIDQGGITTINPAQDTYMQVSFGIPSRADAIALRDNMTVQFSWDGGDWVDVTAGPIYCLHPNSGFQISTHMRAWGYAK
ncbi:MAG TPA: hypothetical protein VFF14_09715, partial [Candidatus Deferrimicrobium sp.]|nr:hypothetical protein [Candidatus Deferrimicrobium sp.]